MKNVLRGIAFWTIAIAFILLMTTIGQITLKLDEVVSYINSKIELKNLQL